MYFLTYLFGVWTIEITIKKNNFKSRPFTYVQKFYNFIVWYKSRSMFVNYRCRSSKFPWWCWLEIQNRVDLLFFFFFFFPNIVILFRKIIIIIIIRYSASNKFFHSIFIVFYFWEIALQLH